MTPALIVHISAGSVAMLSGATALIARKGTRLHRAAGSVFFVSILIAAAMAVYFGFAEAEINFAIPGVITIYFVATAWMTVKREQGKTGVFELGACLFAAAGAAIGFYAAFEAVRNGTALLGGIPEYSFATVFALCAIADLSVILRGGLSGIPRIARHLWRMHLGLFMAVGSFFPGQLAIFPEFIRETPFIVLLAVPFSVIGLMIFWLIRVRFTSWYKRDATVRGNA